MRITVKDRMGTIARGEVEVADPDDDASVRASAKKVCKASGAAMPSPATVIVEEPLGRGRFQEIRRVVL